MLSLSITISIWIFASAAGTRVRPLPHVCMASIPLLILQEDIFHFEVYLDESVSDKIAHFQEGEVLSMSNSTSLEFLENFSQALGIFNPLFNLKITPEMSDMMQVEEEVCSAASSLDQIAACEMDWKASQMLRNYARQVDEFIMKALHASAPVFEMGQYPQLMTLVENNYIKYAGQLKEMKDLMRHVYTNSYATISPQYDDIESELTTLFLLHYQPKRIMEFSPSHGWSTVLILNAIKSYQLSHPQTVELRSYDLEDFCSGAITEYFPSVFHPDSSIEWTLTTGDVRNHFESDFLAPSENPVDYLFIDSDHSKDFVQYYIRHLLTPLLQQARQTGKPIFVSVHDCFVNGIITHEGSEVNNFLFHNQLRYFNPNQEQHQSELRQIRTKTNFSTDYIHFVANNPSIFFILE